MKRKWTAWLLVLAMTAVMLAGCSRSESESTAAPSGGTQQEGENATGENAAGDSDEPRTIVVWHSMSDDAGVLMDQFVSDFNAGVGKEMNIQVESVYQGSYSDTSTKLRTILQNEQYDQLPDVIQIDATGIVDYQNSGYAYTVDDALAADPDYDLSQIMTAPLMAWNYGGVQYGMPFPASTTVMYYNKTLLDEAGITEAPTTFAEITEAAEKLPDTNADGADLTVYAQIPNTPTLANWIGQIPGTDSDASYVVNNRNGRDGTATELVCDKEGTLKTFLTEWKKMYDAGAVANLGSGQSDMFFAGQLVFFTTSTSNLNTLLTTIDGRFELGCSYYPRVNDEANYGATIAGASICMFNKGDEGQAQAAWEFVKYLCSAQVQADLAIGTGYFAVNTGAEEIPEYQEFLEQYPQYSVGLDQLNQTSTDMVNVTVGPSTDFYLTIQDMITMMLEENMDVDEAVEEMSAALNDLLAQYNRNNAS